MEVISKGQYASGPVDLFTQTVNTSTGTALPNLGVSTGIQTTVEKPSLESSWDLNPMLRHTQLTNSNSKFTTFGGVKGFQTKGASKYKTFEEMMKAHKSEDRVGSLEKAILPPWISSMGKTLERPSGGKAWAGVPYLSDAVMKNHWKNYNATKKAHNKANQSLHTEGTIWADLADGMRQYARSESTGYYAIFNNLQYSRDPEKKYFEGNKAALGPNAHNFLKATEAMGNGLDPTFYRLDGENDNNGGVVGMSKNGTEAITEDGYYIWANANSSFGYTKSHLQGAGEESARMAANLGVSNDDLISAMKQARTGDVSFSQALSIITGGAYRSPKIIENPTTMGTVFTNMFEPKKSPTTSSSSTESSSVSTSPDDDPNRDTTVVQSDGYVHKEEDFSGGYFEGMNRGGQVGKSPIGQLAGMLRSNRLGYNTGGRIKGGVYGYQDGGPVNLQEVGFVNGQQPSNLPEGQTVADNRKQPAEENDFVINAPAVEAVTEPKIIALLSQAIQRAAESGVQIVDTPIDIPPEQMTEIFVSDGEVRVPNELVPFVVTPPSQEEGLLLLNKINEIGKPEVENRVGEQQGMAQPSMHTMVSPEERDAISARQFQQEELQA